MRQPMSVRRMATDVYHLVDDNGQLSRWLPPERTVVTCHDLTMLHAGSESVPYDGPRWHALRFRWGVARLRRAARIICPSAVVGREVVSLCGVSRDRVSVIPHGVAPHFRALDDLRRYELHRDLAGDAKHVMLHVDTGGFYKNASGAIRTLAGLRSAGVDVALARVGPPLRPEHTALVRDLRLKRHVFEMGRLSEHRLVEAYNGADLLLFPSFAEGFGWPVLEAMACGLPVVTSNIEVLVDLAGPGGLSAPADDPTALGAAARIVLESPLKAKELAASGMARSRLFSWSDALDAYEQIYEEVALASARRGPTIIGT